jgi:hypothetical protein
MPRKTIIPESKIRRQKNTQWCYAAVIQMILEHYGSKTTQEAIVQTITGSKLNNDTQDPTDYLMNTLNYIDKHGCSKGVLQFKQIKEQIDLNRPIIVLLPGGSGHYVLIVGYDMERLQIIFIDPNKSEYTLEPIDISGITKVNTIYIDAVTRKEHNGPSHIGGFCYTQPPSASSPGSSAKDSSSGTAKGSSRDGYSAKESHDSHSPKGVKGRRGGMKSKKSRKSRSTRKKIRGKSRTVRK